MSVSSESIITGTREPRTIVSWNANSLLCRVRTDSKDVREFLQTRKPDLFGVTEMRMQALGPVGCKVGDGLRRQRHKYSDTEENRELANFMRNLGYRRAFYSLHDAKQSGVALFLADDVLDPKLVRYSLDPEAVDSEHHPEGRVVHAQFSAFDVLLTYVPNSGWDEKSFTRRRNWDNGMMKFLERQDRPLIWVGDLNVAKDWDDVGPNPQWFRDQRNAKPNAEKIEDPDYFGQPGFQPHEQKRFNALLDKASLVDTYRHFHPTPNWKKDVTWRGTASKPPLPPHAARFYGKGMRIDYCLVSKGLMPTVRTCLCLGHGFERKGFLGSDHAPMLLELRDESDVVQEVCTEQVTQIDQKIEVLIAQGEKSSSTKAKSKSTSRSPSPTTAERESKSPSKSPSRKKVPKVVEEAFMTNATNVVSPARAHT